MRVLHVALAMLALGALSACAKLQVRVDVADGAEVRRALAAEAAEEDLLHFVIQSDADLRVQTAALKADVDAAFDALAEYYAARAENYPATGELAEVRSDLLGSARDYRGTSTAEAEIFRQIDDYYAAANTANMALRQIYWRADAADRTYASSTNLPLAEAVAARQRIETELLGGITELLDGLVADIAGLRAQGPQDALAGGDGAAASQSLTSAEQAVQAARARISRSIIAEGSLVGSGYSFALASLDDSYWIPEYNRAFGEGRFGNTNIVIRMNSTGDFSVKGMSFDASTVASVASTVATQSLLLGAQIGGVPVTRQSGGDANALVSAAGQVSSIEQARMGREARRQARAFALIDLAFAVLNEQDALSDGSDQARRDQAADAINQSLNTLRPILTLESSSQD